MWNSLKSNAILNLLGLLVLVIILVIANMIGSRRNQHWESLEHYPRLTEEQAELCKSGGWNPEHCEIELHRRRGESARDER